MFNNSILKSESLKQLHLLERLLADRYSIKLINSGQLESLVVIIIMYFLYNLICSIILYSLMESLRSKNVERLLLGGDRKDCCVSLSFIEFSIMITFYIFSTTLFHFLRKSRYKYFQNSKHDMTLKTDATFDIRCVWIQR